MKRLITLITLIAPTLAFADISDTLESSRVKYGDPVSGIGNAHQVVYNHNECRIAQTYNNDGICVVAEFCRLDGKLFSTKVCSHLDSANLPPMVLNAQSNGWVQKKWSDQDNMRNTICYTWNNGITFYQVIAGHVRFGNETQWYWNRGYYTPEGVQIILADNAQNEPTSEPDQNPKTNI